MLATGQRWKKIRKAFSYFLLTKRLLCYGVNTWQPPLPPPAEREWEPETQEAAVASGEHGAPCARLPAPAALLPPASAPFLGLLLPPELPAGLSGLLAQSTPVLSRRPGGRPTPGQMLEALSFFQRAHRMSGRDVGLGLGWLRCADTRLGERRGLLGQA